jgi:hypothetical protein
MAFSREVRKIIWARDKAKSAISDTVYKLQVAHIDHSKSNPRYNDPSNGRLLGTGEHMWDHILREGKNGLNKAQNDWAILQLWNRFWDNNDN